MEKSIPPFLFGSYGLAGTLITCQDVHYLHTALVSPMFSIELV